MHVVQEPLKICFMPSFDIDFITQHPISKSSKMEPFLKLNLNF